MKLGSLGVVALSTAVVAHQVDAEAANCFISETDYFGYDVEKIFIGTPTESAEKCQEACRNNSDCYYFTYIPERKQCYLKSNGAPNGTVKNPLAISGAKVCPLVGGCYENNVDYEGYDLQKIETGSVPNAQDCQELCAGNDKCYHWTFIPSKMNCYLKYNGATIGRVSHNEAISGPKTCGSTSAGGSGVPCYEADTDYFGYDIKIFDNHLVGTAEECYGLCLAFDECKYWTWVPPLRNCYLKSEYAPLGRVTATGTISGPRNCSGTNLPPYVPSLPTYPPTATVTPPSPYPSYPEVSSTSTTTVTPLSSSCYKTNAEYPSGTIQRLVTDSAYACQRLCQAEEACFFFTFKADFLECTLKDTTAGSTIISRAHTFSGSKNCTGTIPAEFQPPENQVPTSPLPSITETPAANSRTTSGVPMSTTGVQVPSCVESGVEYVGDVLSVLGADSPMECQTLCKLTLTCNYFTYRSDLYRCYMSKEKGTSAVRANTFSGPKECPGEPVASPSSKASCFAKNKAVIGVPLENTTATSALNCQEKCAKSPKCMYFTFITSSTSCQLLRKATGVQEESTAISGPRKCANSQTNLDPSFNEGYYIGQVLKRNNKVASATECRQMCNSFPHSCVAVTYEKATQKCFLMSQADTLQVNSAFVSGLAQAIA